MLVVCNMPLTQKATVAILHSALAQSMPINMLIMHSKANCSTNQFLLVALIFNKGINYY
jgi:hypothetical protein